MADKSHLLAQIAETEALLKSLGEQRQELQQRLSGLTAQLAELERKESAPLLLPLLSASASTAAIPQTFAEKVRLFRTLFRGRDDVYPKLWINPRKERKGYAPACSNEWAPGICDKPRVRCGECLNQAFIPVTEQVILDHLQGRHVIGVYPLLRDETCHLLAADFDRGIGPRTSPPSRRPAERTACRLRWSGPVPATVCTSGSSSPHPSRPRPRGRWAAFF